MSDAAIRFALGIVILTVMFVMLPAAFQIYLLRYRPPPKASAPPPDDGLRKCRGCGDTYHESWGRFCPNCTGAD